MIQKEGLGQTNREIFSLAANLRAGAEFFTATGQTGPIRNVEIALSQFHESDQLIDRAITGAEIERAGSLLFDLNH